MQEFVTAQCKFGGSHFTAAIVYTFPYRGERGITIADRCDYCKAEGHIFW